MDIGDIRYLEVKEPAKVLKLSEAIRIGARIRPQCFDSSKRGGGSCALMAAAEAMGLDYYKTSGYSDIRAFLRDRGVSESARSLVLGMNDEERLSREVIAERLEALGY